MTDKFNLDYFNNTTTKDKNKLLPYIKFYNEIFSQPIENKNILDIGCATGRLFELVNITNNYNGIDISKDAIENARKSYKKGVFEVLDINKQYVKSYYDANLLFMLDVIEHLTNFDYLIDLFKNIKSGSRLILSTPNSNSLERIIFKNKASVEHDQTHTIVFTPYTLDFFLKRCGLKQVFLGTPYNFYFRANNFTKILKFGGQIFAVYEKI